MALGPPGGDEAPNDDVARLTRRWMRERQARFDAERIAEDGLRRLWEANQALDQRVAERTAELDRARRAAESANRAKTEFLANLGHEIRTPLQTVLSTFDLLADVVDADLRPMLVSARDAATGLDRVFTDLLEFAQVEAGAIEMHLRTVDVGRHVDAIADRWRPRLAAVGLLLVVDLGDDLAAVRCDPDRVTQIVEHLLDNAVKHATGGPVSMEVRRDGSDLLVAVSDREPGIGTDHLDRIFEPFVQLAEPSDRRAAGAGLGLAVVRRVAELCGGGAHAVAEPGGGLRVEVRVDAGSPGAPPTAAGPRP